MLIHFSNVHIKRYVAYITFKSCKMSIKNKKFFGVDRVAQPTMSEYTTIQVAKQENMIINLL